jgi:hypothetical protein
MPCIRPSAASCTTNHVSGAANQHLLAAWASTEGGATIDRSYTVSALRIINSTPHIIPCPSFLQPQSMSNRKEHMESRRIAPRPQANDWYTSATRTAKSQAPHHLPSIELKRAQVRAACLPCQRRKSKVSKLQTLTRTFPHRQLDLLTKLP